MDGVPATALCLEPSLTFIADAPVIPAPDALPSLSMPTSTVISGGASARRFVPTIILLPPAARPRVLRSLSDLIDDEIRREASASAQLTQPTIAGEVGDGWAGGVPAVEDSVDGAAEVNVAVIAAHDERIAYLKQQIAVIATEPDSIVRLGFLRARLRRAKAARYLAAIRSGADDSNTDVGAMYAVGAASHSPAQRLTVSRRNVPTGASLFRLVYKGMSGRPNGKSEHNVRVSFGRSHILPARHLADASYHIRHLLATARQALGSNGSRSDSVSPRRSASLRLAGLLRWEGSDSWSLANCPHYTA